MDRIMDIVWHLLIGIPVVYRINRRYYVTLATDKRTVISWGIALLVAGFLIDAIVAWMIPGQSFLAPTFPSLAFVCHQLFGLISIIGAWLIVKGLSIKTDDQSTS